MKKAKFLLVALAVFTIAGGALAYKATRISRIFYLDTTTSSPSGIISVCSVSTALFYRLDPGGVKTIKASTASIDVTCPVISVAING